MTKKREGVGPHEREIEGYRKWTLNDDRKLKEMYLQSIKDAQKQIAKKFRRSRGAIRSRIAHFRDSSNKLYDVNFDSKTKF